MTSPLERTDRSLAAWIHDGPERGPDQVLEAALAATRTVRQRPAWQVAGAWLPWRSERRPPAWGIALTAAAILLLILVAIALVGSRQRLPAPFGPAANGRIAFDTGRGGGVWLANADGSGARRIPGEGIERTPSFSPDGTLFTYWSRPDDGADPATFSLFIAKADGSDPRRIAPNQRFATDPRYAARWSPDSTHLTFSASDPDGVSRIWVVAIDGSPAVPITSRMASRTNPTWSPNGTWIAFNESSLVYPPKHTIAIIQPDGNETRPLHSQDVLGSIGTEAGFGETLRWSPDSTRIAYNRGKDPARTSEADAFAQYLVIVDIDRPDSDRAVYGEASGWLHFPAWSPDGRSLAFVVGETANDLHVFDPETDADRVIGHCSQPLDALDWSPDGRWLTMGCPDGAELRSVVGSATDPGLPLDDRSRAIDIQRVAP